MPEQKKMIERSVQPLPLEIQGRVREYIELLLDLQNRATDPSLSVIRDTRESYTTALLEQEALSAPDPLAALLGRIDSMMAELQALRRDILTQQRSASQDLAAELYGAWGQGVGEEYEPDVEWQRFSDE